MLIGMVAGEASGDFLGAELITALRERRTDLRFAGIGGPRMRSAGLESWFPMERLAVRGYAEVLRSYPALWAMRQALKSRMAAARPALFVGVDAPDFNLSVEASLKRRGIPTVHYVSPSVWAWRSGRVRSIGRAIDHLLALFPFEPEIYRRAGIPATFVGHPMADEIAPNPPAYAAREQLRLPAGARVYALLPGSRASELRYMAETFAMAARRVAERVRHPRFVVPFASRETRQIFEEALFRAGANELPFTLLFGHAREALAACDAALVASGTATLEAALIARPMVITYRMSAITWKIMSRLQLQPWVGLPNIIAGEFLVPEILQDEATPENLADALVRVSEDPAIHQRLPARFAGIHAVLKRGASQRAAEAVLSCLKPC
ncbi:MAG: lipid-A-disaccharide synthase [Burkholderiales bacterium]|nr:lipid-A-disaccharide synthase [Burkholderiales bacterium]